jgi:hypothetical protein
MLSSRHVWYACSEYVLITKPAGVEEAPKYRGIKSRHFPHCTDIILVTGVAKVIVNLFMTEL